MEISDKNGSLFEVIVVSHLGGMWSAVDSEKRRIYVADTGSEEGNLARARDALEPSVAPP